MTNRNEKLVALAQRIKTFNEDILNPYGEEESLDNYLYLLKPEVIDRAIDDLRAYEEALIDTEDISSDDYKEYSSILADLEALKKEYE